MPFSLRRVVVRKIALNAGLLAMMALGLTASAAFTAPTASKPALHSAIEIPYTNYRLPNGLNVILAEDHRTPTVAVVVMYHVGSKNEKPGRTGFAHLFEHVMFTGSGHVPYGLHDRYTEGVGGGNNGSTSNDVTEYHETIPSNYLETALWLESDRMGWLLDALDLNKLNAQRDVVKNERRQSIDNQPYGRVDELIAEALYPSGHPFSWPVIGSMKDLAAASEEDVKEFFRLYYAPNNATLSIAGDFNPEETREWISKYFDPIPKGKPITRPKVPAVKLSTERRLVYEDRVQLPQLTLRWPTVGSRHRDEYALSILGSILTGSRTGRLTKPLVYDTQAAASVDAGQWGTETVGEFEISLTPRPGHTLRSLEQATDSVLEGLKRVGPSQVELQKAKAGAELAFVLGLESNLGKAMTLAEGAVTTGNAAHFQEEYRLTQAVTAADVKRVANQYLTAGRVVMSAVPLGKKQLASLPEKSKVVGKPTATGAVP